MIKILNSIIFSAFFTLAFAYSTEAQQTSSNKEIQELINSPKPAIVPNEESSYWKKKILTDVSAGKDVSLYVSGSGRLDTTRYIRDNSKDETATFKSIENDLNSKLSEFFARILDKQYHGPQNKEHIDRLSGEIDNMFDVIEKNGGKYIPLLEKDTQLSNIQFLRSQGQEFEIQKNMYLQNEKEYREQIENEKY